MVASADARGRPGRDAPGRNYDAQTALLGSLWRSTSPATLPVLEAIGKMHTVKFVAKAARKAAFQRRTWEANR